MTPDAGLPDGGSVNFAFVTSTWYGGNLGGLAGADAICQAHANDAGLPGTYRAWLTLADAGLNGAQARLNNARGWIGTDNRPFADTADDLLISNRLFYPLTLDERGDLATNDRSWTGLIGTRDCLEWTSNASAESGEYGAIGSVSKSWYDNSSQNCGRSSALYCLGIDHFGVVDPVAPAGVRRAFVSENTWSVAGGVAGADSFCASTGGSRGLGTNWRAFLALDGGTAASRFSADGGAWARLDGVLLADTAAALLAGDTIAALNVTEQRHYLTGSSVAWIGAQTPTSISDATCSDWTTNQLSPRGRYGFPAAVSWFKNSSSPQTCAVNASLYCLEP